MKINGVEVEERNELISNIEKHFGSIYAFSKTSGFSYSILKRTLINLDFSKEDFDAIKASYKANYDPEKVPFRISEEDRKRIRMCILENFKNSKKFTEKHTEYDSVYLSNVINGRLKLRSNKYVNFISLLEKKYGLDLN